MNGLDSITDAIISEAQQRASENIKAAEDKKDVLMSETEEELAQIEKAAKQKGKKDSEMVITRAETANEQYLRQQLMLTRMKFIDEVIKEAQKKIEDMPDDEYFDAMEKLVKASAHKDKGVIQFGSRDLSRMPQDFIKRCEQAADGIQLELSPEAAPIESGFVIRYGDIEENCSLESIFVFRYDELCDLVSGYLSGAEQ